MFNFDLLKDIGRMKPKVDEMQSMLGKKKVTGSAGGGMVEVVCNGKKEIVDIKIDPEIAGNVKILRDLLLSAISDAQKKADKIFIEEMSKVAGSLLSKK
ncbi:YbaB/EbfC family nucleoid-associated protein [bacterium]|nr:YbaB/EbfC family nucleoid-associated protein [bacterium]MBU1599477.1 YbaB/EbfC family nucleoid-associated protein [bacterium]MBU2462434.1 YbaB/EbfC family nucleoid-associated protein [bacterium]